MSVNEVAVEVATCTLSRNTWYPATPTLSVEAVQPSETVEVDTAVTMRSVGVEGGVLSGGEDSVVAVRVVGFERFPSLSDAQSATAYVVLAVSPVSTSDVEEVAIYPPPSQLGAVVPEAMVMS